MRTIRSLRLASLVIALAAPLGAQTREVGYHMAPVFIESATRIWTVMRGGDGGYYPAYSIDHGTTWRYLRPDVQGVPREPSSVFVHRGFLYVALPPEPCGRGRILRYRIAGGSPNHELVRYLEQTATVRTWGWAVDGVEGDLWVAEYGQTPSAPPECVSNAQVPTAFLLRIADGAGEIVATGAPRAMANWRWYDCNPEDCPGAWFAPRGSTADLHNHVLRWDAHAVGGGFIITGGDSPRTLLTWSGRFENDVARTPLAAVRCCSDAYVLTGFTGVAALPDAVYVADDWTSFQADHPSIDGRHNAIRRYRRSGGRLVYDGSSTLAGVVASMPADNDTPLYDMHATADGRELYIVNHDEPRSGDPAIRKSGLHRLARSSTADRFPDDVTTLVSHQSSYRNWIHVAADAQGAIPDGMPYVFLYGIGDAGAGTTMSVIMRVVRAPQP